MAALPLQTNTQYGCRLSLLVTAGTALAKGTEVKFGANVDTIALAADANTGIGLVLQDVPINFPKRVDVECFFREIVPVVQNGTAVAGVRAISGANGKFVAAGAAPDARALRGIFLATSAVDGAIVPLGLF